MKPLPLPTLPRVRLPRELTLGDLKIANAYELAAEAWLAQESGQLKRWEHLVGYANDLNRLAYDSPTMGTRFKWLPGDMFLHLLGEAKAKKPRRNPRHQP